MMVAVVLGGIGADIPSWGILAVGFASLTTQSVSMGFGAYMVETTNEDFVSRQLMAEVEEVRGKPLEEIEEMVCHYTRRGISEEDARAVAAALSKYEDFWVEHMMVQELGLTMPRGKAVAIKSGLATCLSCFLCGLVPLLGVVVSLALRWTRGPGWYRPQFSSMVALVLTAAALAMLGLSFGHAFGSRAPYEGGALLLAQGCFAAGFALWLSQRCRNVFRVQLEHTEPLIRTSSGGTRPAGGCAEVQLGGSPASSVDVVAWPSFRRKFFHGILWLWVVVSTWVVLRQFAVEVDYDSFRVWSYGMLTCVTTGLGAVPFFWARPGDFEEKPLALANSAAGGTMLAASVSMLLEAHEHSGRFDWQILAGLLVGAVFIRASEHLSGSSSEDADGESDFAVLHQAFMDRRHMRKAMLIFTVMFCHSAAEGVAVGVAFSKRLNAQFGIFMSLLLAVHNVPEGLAVALVLVPRGVSAPLAFLIAILTSVPQPFMAVAAFFFVDAFSWMLPIGLAFAAGAMIYVCVRELLQEAIEQLGWSTALSATVSSFAVMYATVFALQAAIGD
jgi:zinc transporter ZupT